MEAIFELQNDLVPRIVSTVDDKHGESVLRVFGYFERITPEEHLEVRRIMEAAVREAPTTPTAGPCCP